MTSPHWREKARDALTRGGQHLGIPLAGMLDRLHYDQLLQLQDQLVSTVAGALQSAYEDGERGENDWCSSRSERYYQNTVATATATARLVSTTTIAARASGAGLTPC